MPSYSVRRKGGGENLNWNVATIRESECPVSAITQKSFDLVNIVNTLQGAHISTGSSVGADAMPGYLLDAIRICQSESRACEAAMDEANQ